MEQAKLFYRDYIVVVIAASLTYLDDIVLQASPVVREIGNYDAHNAHLRKLEEQRAANHFPVGAQGTVVAKLIVHFNEVLLRTLGFHICYGVLLQALQHRQ